METIYLDMEDNKTYTGKTLKHMDSCSGSYHQLRFISKEHNYISPYSLDENKSYDCLEYTRVSGSGVEYTTITILNYENGLE